MNLCIITPENAALPKMGAASTAPWYLAAALERRGHQVELQYSDGDQAVALCEGTIGSVEPSSIAGHDGFDAVIASRHVWLAHKAKAPRKFVWLVDQFGHEVNDWTGKFVDVQIVAWTKFIAGVIEPLRAADHVIPCGVPDHLFGFPIYPGAGCYTSCMWCNGRRVEAAIQAVRLARETAPRVTLDVFGDETLWAGKHETYGTMLDRMIKETAGVMHGGCLTQEHMFDILEHRDILIHPTTFETQGMAVCQAMAAGNPVVTTSAGSLPELGMVNPLFSQHCHPATLAEEIVKLATDASYYRSIAEGNRLAAERFRWSKVAEEWEALCAS